MKQMTESELKEIIRQAFDEGFDTGVSSGNAYDPAVIDCERDDYADSVVDSL